MGTKAGRLGLGGRVRGGRLLGLAPRGGLGGLGRLRWDVSLPLLLLWAALPLGLPCEKRRAVQGKGGSRYLGGAQVTPLNQAEATLPPSEEDFCRPTPQRQRQVPRKAVQTVTLG